MAVDIGTGTTITHGTSSYSVEIQSIALNEITRAVVDTSHMGTAGARTKTVGDLYDPGSLTVSAHLNPNEPAPYSGASETVTVTFPIPAGGLTGATLAGTAAVTSFSASVPLEDKMVCTYTITFLDDITWTDAT